MIRAAQPIDERHYLMMADRRKLFKILGLVALLILVGFLTVFAWLYYPALKPVKPEAEASITGGGLPLGCTCHSKNPRFVSMHQLFSVQDCRKCHGQGEDLMGKKSSKMTPERKAALEKRIKAEPICQECHRGKEIVVAKKSEISGRLYCPKEKKMYRKNEVIKRGPKYYCRKHGVELIDVDAIAVKSAKEPKNEYCIACHPVDQALNRGHQKVMRASGLTNIEDCLRCHTSHSQCGGCHF